MGKAKDRFEFQIQKHFEFLSPISKLILLSLLSILVGAILWTISGSILPFLLSPL